MSKVSMRQQKTATPVAEAVTEVTTPATSVATAPPSEQPPAWPEEWRTAATESRGVVLSLVQEVMTSEADRVGNNSGRVDRLLGFVLDELGRVQPASEKDDVECYARDAEAALAGAMHVLEAESGAASDQLKLRHAFQILDKLTDALAGDEIYPVWDAIRYAPKPKEAAHDPLYGYTRHQAATVFKEIATKADTLGDFLRHMREGSHSEDGSALYSQIDMAASMADLVGLLADMPVNGCIKGDSSNWILGPIFEELRKAVSA